MEPFGNRPNSTLRSYDSGDSAQDSRRAARDAEELRKERGVIRIPDIAYASSPDTDPRRQILEIYLQEGLTDAPVVLYCAWRGWVRGDKRRSLFKPAALVPEGYLFASMNYRFRPEASLAEMAQDVATAAVWLWRNAAHYGGDGSKIALMGHSAGAHLVSAVGTNEAFMSEAGAALADLACVVAIDTAMYNVPLQMQLAAASQARAFGTDPAASMPVSPWHHIEPSKGIPPFLLLVTDGRPTMQQQVIPLVGKMQDAGIEASAYEAAGRGHGPIDT